MAEGLLREIRTVLAGFQRRLTIGPQGYDLDVYRLLTSFYADAATRIQRAFRRSRPAVRRYLQEMRTQDIGVYFATFDRTEFERRRDAQGWFRHSHISAHDLSVWDVRNRFDYTSKFLMPYYRNEPRLVQRLRHLLLHETRYVANDGIIGPTMPTLLNTFIGEGMIQMHFAHLTGVGALTAIAMLFEWDPRGRLRPVPTVIGDMRRYYDPSLRPGGEAASEEDVRRGYFQLRYS